MSSIIIVTPQDIRDTFKEFEDLEMYPNDFVSIMIDLASNFISNGSGQIIKDSTRKYLIELMTAHLLLKHSELNNSGGSSSSVGGIVASSTVGSVSVSMAIPQSRDSLEYWLNQTAYGQEYQALLSSFNASAVLFFGTNNRVYRGNVR